MAEVIQYGEREPWRSKAYAQLSNALKNHGECVSTVAQIDALPRTLPSGAGAGKGMRTHLQEILETGRYQKLERRRQVREK